MHSKTTTTVLRFLVILFLKLGYLDGY